MKYFIFSFFCLFAWSCYSQEKDHVQPALPHIFGEFNNVRDFTISPNEKEAYFTGQSPLGELSVIFRLNLVNGNWSEPNVCPFSGKYHDLEPFLTSDGLRLYFVSNRPLEGEGDAKDYDIWFVRRNSLKDAWSAPINLGGPVNSEHHEFYPAVADNYNLYFTSDRPGSMGKDDIFVSRWTNDSYTSPISVSDSVNTDGYEFNAFIAPDESFILFTGYQRKDGYGSGDLYLCKKVDGEWQQTINLGGEINSPQMDYCPYVKNGKLYFTSRRSSIRKPHSEVKTLADFLKEVNRYDNGTSRIYQAKFAVK